MDWTKAKNILIVALILTNIVLIFSYVHKNRTDATTSDTILNDTIRHLEGKDIYINTEVPKEFGRRPVLHVEYDTIDEQRIAAAIEAQGQSTPHPENDEQMIRLAVEFLEESGLYSKYVTFDRLEEKGDVTTIRFKNCIEEDILLENSYIICRIKDGRVVSLEGYWLKPIEYGKTKKQITPASKALIKFSSMKDSDEKITIEDISLIYWLDSGSFEGESPVSDTAFPTWKITYNGDKTAYIVAHDQ